MYAHTLQHRTTLSVFAYVFKNVVPVLHYIMYYMLIQYGT